MSDYLMVDADTHMIEPRDLWTVRTEKKFRDRAPYVVHNPQSLEGDYWIIEGMNPVSAVGGGFLGAFRDPKKFEEFIKTTQVEELRPGGWDPAARLADMAVDGVGAGIGYPTSAAPLFSLADGKLQAALFRAYD